MNVIYRAMAERAAFQSINMLMKINELRRGRRPWSYNERLPFLKVIYRNHAHELAEIEVERAREELRQLQADVLNTLADTQLTAAKAEEAESEAELTQDQKNAIKKIF